MIAASTNLNQPHPDLVAAFYSLLRDSVQLQRQMVFLMGQEPCVPSPPPLANHYLRDLMELNQAQIELASKPPGNN